MRQFFHVLTTEANYQVISVRNVAKVQPDGQGILIDLHVGGSVQTTTYDLEGFVSNVLEDDGMLAGLAEEGLMVA